MTLILFTLRVQCSHRRVPLEDDDPAALVASGEEVAVLVELDAGDDVRLGDVVVEGALDLGEGPLDLGGAGGCAAAARGGGATVAVGRRGRT